MCCNEYTKCVHLADDLNKLILAVELYSLNLILGKMKY